MILPVRFKVSEFYTWCYHITNSTTLYSKSYHVFIITYAVTLRGLEHGLIHPAEEQLPYVLRSLQDGVNFCENPTYFWHSKAPRNVLPPTCSPVPPPSKPVTINYEWEMYYSFLPAKLLGTFACTMEMHTRSKVINLNGEENQVQDKTQINFLRFNFCVVRE